MLERKAAGNPSQVAVQLIRKMKVPVTASTVMDTIEHHPDYPSMYSISDSLRKWNIESLALQIEPERINELPVPFIAHSTVGRGNFILVNKVNCVVDYIDEKGKRRQKGREEFDKEWSKIVLLAEKNEQSGEQNYLSSKRRQKINTLRIPLIILAFLLLIGLYSVFASDLFITSLLLLKLAGCVVTGLLLWFEIDKSNPVIQQICSGGKNPNCTAVLSSKEAKLFNFLSWSEVGFFYFTGSFLFLMLNANQYLSGLSLVSWLNLLALPYIVFSIIYQWRVAKQWCLLCLSVQGVLVLEFVAGYFGYWSYSQSFNFSSGEIVPLLSSFLVPISFWAAAKKIYMDAQNGQTFKKELSKLKYNKEIFTTLLSKQNQLTTLPEGLGITLGNPTASNTIIKVCNPYCGPCAKAHSLIEEVLKNNDDVKVQVIFAATSDEDDIKAKPVKHLMALHERNDNALIQRALSDWYNVEKKDYQVFSGKYYLMNDELQKQGSKLDAMDKWCKETAISFTPTFFVNGYKLPESYRIEDLKHLL